METHCLGQVNLHRQVDQMDLLQEQIWMVTECLHHLQVIWDQDQMDQWDLHQMIWVECILTWMTLVHIINQDQTDLKDLLRELTWMATEWLRLHHLMIHLTM